MNGIELPSIVYSHLLGKDQCIGLYELKRIMGLWLDVHTNYIEPSPVVPHCCATSTTEQVK